MVRIVIFISYDLSPLRYNLNIKLKPTPSTNQWPFKPVILLHSPLVTSLLLLQWLKFLMFFNNNHKFHILAQNKKSTSSRCTSVLLYLYTNNRIDRKNISDLQQKYLPVWCVYPFWVAAEAIKCCSCTAESP